MNSPLTGRAIRPVRFLAVGMLLQLAGCGGGGGDAAIPPFWLHAGVAVADLNGDGLADVVVAKSYISGPPPHLGRVDVYLQAAPGTFATPVTYAIGSDPWGLALGDVNGDGKLDIVTANSGSGSVSILLQDAGTSGAFQMARNLAVGGVPYAVTVADVDADGRADLAVALQNSGGGAVVLLQSRTTPMSFPSPLSLSNGSGALSVAVGDLNQDGRPDVAVVNDSGVQVFFQSAAGGTFGSPSLISAGTRPQSLVVTDLDTDGFNDLAVANAGSSSDGTGASVSVLLQRTATPGTFAPAVNFPVADGARQLAVGQVVGDSKPDIAIVSLVYQALGQASKIDVLRNQGGGVFVLDSDLPGPPNADFLSLGDVNGDGLTDLVVNDGPALILQLPAPPGSFAAYTPLP